MSTEARGDDREERLQDIVAGYLERLGAGTAEGREELLARHPEFAAELAEFFAVRDRIEGVAAPLRHIAHGPAEEHLPEAKPTGPAAGPGPTEVADVVAALGRLGDFRIVREVGRGGMGVVYEAEQLSIGRRVALKLLPFASSLDPRQLQRFRNEARAAGQLHHSHIVPVHWVGCERGVHFYAMQFIDGQTLGAVIKELRRQARAGACEPAQPPTASEALAHDLASGRWVPAPKSGKGRAVVRSEAKGPGTGLSGAGSGRSTAYFRAVAQLGVQAAEALDYAHQAGVVHRDVKPANLMLDVGGHLWVTDFGLAHFHSEASLTRTGDLLGTLRYMSPEQALAKRVVIDHRTDIYSLGVTLYELLTLEPALDGRDREELLRQIAFEEPRPPRQRNRAIPVELDTIVRKALEKNPADRYATAQELADDLRRYLEDRPIQARRPTLAQRLRKWARRHQPVVLTAAAAGLLLLALTVVGLAVSNWLIRQEQVRTAAANRELYLNLYYQTIALAERESSTGNVGRAEQLLDTKCPEELRGWEWHYLKRLRYGSPSPLRHQAPVWDLAVSPDGNLLVSVDFTGRVYLWDGRNGLPLPNSLTGAEGSHHKMRFSPDGRYLATLLLRDGSVRLWDTATGKPGPVFPPGRPCAGRNLAFSPRTGLLAVAYEEPGPAVGVWDLATGRERLQLPGRNDVDCLAFSPDGQRLAVDNGTQLQVWDLQTGGIAHPLATAGNWLTAAAFSPDGRYLAAAGWDANQHGDRSVVRVWDAATGALVYDLQGHVGLIKSLAFSPDARRLVTGGFQDRVVRVWDVTTGKEALTLYGHAGPILAVAFSPDGRRIYSASQDHTVRVWDATPLSESPGPELRVLRGHTGRVSRVAWSPDGKYLASGGVEGTVLLWDLEAGRLIHTLQGYRGASIEGLQFSADGSRLAGAGSVDDPEVTEDVGLLKVWDIPAGRELLAVPPRRLSALSGVGFLPGSTALALAAERRLEIVDATTGNLLQTSPLLPKPISLGCLAMGPRGRYVAGSTCNCRVLVWDVPRYPDSCAACAVLAPLPVAHALASVLGRLLLAPPRVLTTSAFVPALAFSGDGRYLAAASTDGPLHVWDTAGWQPLPDLKGHAGQVWGLATSPDGRHLASAGSDGTGRLWDVRTRAEVSVLRGHTDAVWGVAFSPDGRRLASAGRDQTVRIWDVRFLTERVGRGPADAKAEQRAKGATQ